LLLRPSLKRLKLSKNVNCMELKCGLQELKCGLHGVKMWITSSKNDMNFVHIHVDCDNNTTYYIFSDRKEVAAIFPCWALSMCMDVL